MNKELVSEEKVYIGYHLSVVKPCINKMVELGVSRKFLEGGAEPRHMGKGFPRPDSFQNRISQDFSEGFAQGFMQGFPHPDEMQALPNPDQMPIPQIFPVPQHFMGYMQPQVDRCWLCPNFFGEYQQLQQHVWAIHPKALPKPGLVNRFYMRDTCKLCHQIAPNMVCKQFHMMYFHEGQLHGRPVVGPVRTKKKAKRSNAVQLLEAQAAAEVGKDSATENSKPIVNVSTPSEGSISGNPIGALQELCMSRKWATPVYDVSTEVGAAHNRNFTMNCIIGNHSEPGAGTSKKLAKREAAQKMLHKLLYSTGI